MLHLFLQITSAGLHFFNTVKVPTILSNSAEMRLRVTGLRHTALLVQVYTRMIIMS